MLKSILKGDWNSGDEDFHEISTKTTKVKQMDRHQDRRNEGEELLEEDRDLLSSIDELIEEIELNLPDPNKPTSSSESEDGDWEAIQEAVYEQIDLEMDIKFLIEDYERAHQDILVGRNNMSKLLQEIKEVKQQESAESSDAHEDKPLEVNAKPPQRNILEDKELQESFKYSNKSFLAEPHIKTHKSELLSEEKLQNLNLEECLNLLKWFEADLQQEKRKNKAAQEELEKVKLSCAEEIQKHKTELDNVRQQLESLQRGHKKTIKEHSDLCQQELKKTKAAYEEQLQNHKDELKDFKRQYEILQQDLKKARETIEREQSSGEAPLEQEHPTCKKDLRQKFDSFRADLKKSKLDLQSSESSLFMRGLGSMEMLSNQGMLHSFKNSEKNVRSRVLSLQSELEDSRKETQQEKKLCDRLQQEKDIIMLSYKEQQNQLSYTKRHFESVRVELEDYKTRSESKTEEMDHLRKDWNKVKKSLNKDPEKTDGKISDSELEPQNDKKKRHSKDYRAQEGNDALELLTERKRRKKHRKNKPRTENEQKASDYEDPQTSQQTQKTKKSAFTKMCHFFGWRK
ncbi:hypothetical protein D4764_16G0010550 [Takifugu flavidus]|uniref:Uncharacterized protein n=1 Tax=Takifugu flavidus TaxID=433684 RepID=A0A5C6P0C2_9TELE|nr:hypothetical protein D4764_16G0010550 [Takifugu flavidus]